MSNAEQAANYIADVLADFHDNPPPNDVSALVHATVEMHLGAVRFLLLGEPEKAMGLLANFEIGYRMKRVATESA